MSVPVAFQGEVQLLGWSESHSTGAKIVLQLADADDLEAFKLMTVAKGKVAGQRLAIVAVEIGDDEQPVNPPNSGEIKPKGGPLAELAGQLCKNPDYLAFRGGISTREAILDMYFVCDIDSRSELDHDENAADRFHEEIRLPFLAWKEKRK